MLLYCYYYYDFWHDKDISYKFRFVTICELRWEFGISLRLKLASYGITCFQTMSEYYEFWFESDIYFIILLGCFGVDYGCYWSLVVVLGSIIHALCGLVLLSTLFDFILVQASCYYLLVLVQYRYLPGFFLVDSGSEGHLGSIWLLYIYIFLYKFPIVWIRQLMGLGRFNCFIVYAFCVQRTPVRLQLVHFSQFLSYLLPLYTCLVQQIFTFHPLLLSTQLTHSHYIYTFIIFADQLTDKVLVGIIVRLR